MLSQGPVQLDPDVAPAPKLELVRGRTSAREVHRRIELSLAEGRPRHFRFLLSRLRRREDAEDVLQDFSLKAIQGAARVENSAKINAWLNVSLRNTLFDHYRRVGARLRMQDGAATEPSAAETGAIDEDLERPLGCTTRAVGALKPSYADLIRRAELLETPLKLIAAEAGLTANNVAVRLHRAREALRREMQVRCAACPARCAIGARFVGEDLLERCSHQTATLPSAAMVVSHRVA